MASSLILTDIYIYPIKSLGGVRVDQTLVEPQGLQYDRRWMLVDENGTFLTQRVFPELVLLQVQLLPTGLLITHKQKSAESLLVSFDYRNYLNTPLTVTIWNDTVAAIEVSHEANTWFSWMLQKSCRLVFMPPYERRPVDPDYAFHQESVSFADAYPFLLIGQESLNDLNNRLSEPVPMNRFRPNLVFSGGAPFTEDNWYEFKIGNQKFAAVKPCARCVLTTVNQDTAEKGTEPLRTLATYRTINKKVMFGQNILLRSGDQLLQTGNTISVLSYRLPKKHSGQEQ